MNLSATASSMLNHYRAELAKQYGLAPEQIKEQFNVSPPMETRLRDALLASADFLNRITMADVDQLTGQVVEVGIGGLYTGRKENGRFTKNVGVAGNSYTLVETDSCAALPWATLSSWANSGGEGEFFARVNSFANRCFALDMIRIGWHGVAKTAATTDPTANPNGEDVNKGWIQLAKEFNNGSQVVTTKVYFDADGAGDYKTLDAIASDIINNQIDPVYRTDPRLVVLVGADLLSAAQARLFDEANKPTEQQAAQSLANTIAGRPAMSPPFFPANAIVVTMLENLHLYTQRGTRQRQADNNQDRKAWENKYWRNEGYAIGDYMAFGAATDVVIGPKP
jgi:P2 family phage major capsid protein